MSIYYIFLCFILVIALIDLFLINNKNHSKILFALFFFTVLVFIGLRYQTGLDWLFYYNLYNGESYTLAIEPGYYLLSYIASLAIGYWFYQALITAVLLLALKKFFIRNTNNYLFCVALFISYQFIFVTEALRQIIALAIVMMAFVKYSEGKKKKFYILIALSATFHVSALIVFIIPLLSNKRNINILKIFTFVGILLAVVNIYAVDYIIKLLSILPSGGYIDKFLWYSQDDYAGSILTFSLAFKLAMILLFELRFKNIKTFANYRSEHLSLYVIQTAVYVMLLIDVYLGRFGTISTRLDVYFIPFFLVMVAYLINEFKKGISRVLISTVIMAYFIINFIGIMDGYYFDNFYKPYQNYIVEMFNPGAYKDRAWDVGFYFSNKDLLQ